MKKFVAIVMMVILTLSLGVMAQAEVGVTRFGQELVDGEYVYYLIYESDTGNSAKLYVTEDEWEAYIYELFERREAEYKAQNPGWFQRTVNAIVFWD